MPAPSSACPPRTAGRLLAAAALALTTNASAQNAFDPGVAVQIYQLDASGLERVPRLAASQTPNVDEQRNDLDLTDDAPIAEPPQGVALTRVSARLNPAHAGDYRFRLSGPGALRLFLGGHFEQELPLNSGDDPDAVRVVEVGPFNWGLPNPLSVVAEQYGAVAADRLRVEWIPPGGDTWEAVPAERLETLSVPTRVTAPGPKRLANTRRAGDGNPVGGVHPAFTQVDLLPEGIEPMTGAMAFLPDGRLVIGTFRPLQRNEVALPDIDSKDPDKLYEVRHAAKAATDGRVTTELVPVAEGLYEPSGLCVVDGDLYVAHRKAITRLTDTDGDGFFETHHPIASGWEGWNYHQFCFGLVHRDGKLYAALSTAMGPPKWEGMGTNANVNGPLRGCVLEIDLASADQGLNPGSFRVIAGGTRTPNTVGLGPDNTLLYCDNQGTWFPSSTMSVVEDGAFFGHYNRTNVVPKLAERFPTGGAASAYGDRPRRRQTAWLPQNEFVNSPTQTLLIPDGPFAGQVLLGELTSGGIRRVAMEKVNGQWQAAAFRFTQGLTCGVNRMAWGPDGHLYIGGIGASGNWSWQNKKFGLERLEPSGETAFEMHRVTATPDGFEVFFTGAVDPAWLADPKNYEAEQWGYTPTAGYGGAKVNREGLAVAAATPHADGRGVRLTLNGLKKNRVVYLRTDPVSTAGEAMWSTECYYTLNEIPRAEPVVAQLDGYDLDLSDPAAALGVDAAVPVGGVQLVGRSFRGHLFPTAGDAPKMPNRGALTQNDLLPPAAGDDGVALDPANGPLRTAGHFAGFRLHVEWFGSVAGPGLRLPGGLRLPAAPDADDAERAAPRWHADDLWFQPSQADRPARLTLVRNGELIHHDIAVGPPRAVDPAPLELAHPDTTGATPQRLRNVWAAPLKDRGEHGHAAAGPWQNLLADAPDAWTVCGGKSTFELDAETGVLTGTAVANSGGNTFRVTRATYGDFELQAEVWTDSATDAATDGSKGLNSGIQIRSHVDGGVDQRDGRIRGYQVEVDPTDRRYSGGIFDEGRRGWLAPLIAAPYARDAWVPGTWNRILIRAEGPVIRTWVNGVPAACVMDALTARGHIGLQVHGVGARDDRPQVRFRNVMLRELETAGR